MHINVAEYFLYSLSQRWFTIVSDQVLPTTITVERVLSGHTHVTVYFSSTLVHVLYMCVHVCGYCTVLCVCAFHELSRSIMSNIFCNGREVNNPSIGGDNIFCISV